MSWFPKWQPYTGDMNTQPVATNEYLPVGQSIMLGLQHVLAMFGATVLAPLLMGFDANLAIMMSGICTMYGYDCGFCTWIFTAFVTPDRFGDGICNLCDSDQYFGFR